MKLLRVKKAEKVMEIDLFYLIKKWEGLKLKAYKCPAGKWTVGYGSTFYPDGTPVKEGDTITEQEANNLLAWYCTTQIQLPKGTFNPKQKMSLYSLIYNIGAAAFNRSKCKSAIEKEDWLTAYNNWTWIKANGKILKGLVNRRNEEKALFFEGLIDTTKLSQANDK